MNAKSVASMIVGAETARGDGPQGCDDEDPADPGPGEEPATIVIEFGRRDGSDNRLAWDGSGLRAEDALAGRNSHGNGLGDSPLKRSYALQSFASADEQLSVGDRSCHKRGMPKTSLAEDIRAALARAPVWVRVDLAARDEAVKERAEETLAAMIAAALEAKN